MPTIRTPQPLPISLPGLSVVSYAAATAMPIGISLDRKTVYGAANGSGTTLYQSTNDGTSWTSVKVFAEPVLGILELDDGEALVITQAAGSSPGYVYRSTGWSTSHTTATWTKTLTTTSSYIRPAWGGGHFCSFGNNKIRSGTSSVGVFCEYGSQTTATGSQTVNATRVYLTTDGGLTFTVILDLAVRYPGVYPLHTHAVAYDPYWDRIWVLYGDTPAEGNTKADILYSDDRGATWTAVPLNGDWSGTGVVFQSTTIAVLRDCLVFGADNAPGFFRMARKGYRVLGDLQVSAIVAGHTNSQMIAYGMHRNRNQAGGPLLASYQSQQTTTTAQIMVSLDDGATLARLWGDDALRGSGKGISTVFGPTYTGKILAWVSNSTAFLLVGELIVPDPGMLEGVGTVVGDGTTTVFSFPHGLPAQPSRFQAWPEKPVTGTYTVTATATNIVITFATAPINAASLPFQWRAAV